MNLWLLAIIGWGAFLLQTDVGLSEDHSKQDDYSRQRHELIDSVLKQGGIKHPGVLASIASTPRHEFVPLALRDQSYLDRALPIGESQTISSPFIVALMTEVLQPEKTDKVLEIGTGSGYRFREQ